jgi:hypothetical protein
MSSAARGVGVGVGVLLGPELQCWSVSAGPWVLVRECGRDLHVVLPDGCCGSGGSRSTRKVGCGPAGGSSHEGRRGRRHKMLWLECPPRLPGHKMSENYTRVIPPLSTTCFRLSRSSRPPGGPGSRPGGCCGCGAVGALPEEGGAAARTSGRASLEGPPLKEPSCQPRTSERQPPFRRSRRSGVPGSNLRTAPCGAIGEQPCELPVDCRWTTGVVLHSYPQAARERRPRGTL